MTKKSDAPAIRFKGFSDAWEQRKLGDIADIVGGGTPSTGNQSYWDGDIDWYAPAEIADQIYANSSQKKITGLGYENSSAKMLPPGTVLFTSRAGIGKTAILTRKGCTNQGFQSIVPHRGELDSYFIFSRTIWRACWGWINFRRGFGKANGCNGADDAANDARTTDYWRFLSAARPPYHPSSA